MARQVLIWGTGEVANVLVHLIHETELFDVVGLCVDNEFWRDGMKVCGIDVMRFNEAIDKFPPNEVEVMVAVGFKRLNGVRREILDRFISLGYSPVSFIHPSSYIAPSVRLGRHVLIMPKVVLEPGVKIGDNVFIWSGAVVCHDVRVEKDAFIAGGVVVGGGTVIGEGSFLGMNAVVRDHRSIGRGCVVGAGVYVRKDISDNHIIRISNQTYQVSPIDNLPL